MRRSRDCAVPLLIPLLVLWTGLAAAAPVSDSALMGKLAWRSVGPYIGGRVVTVTGVPGNPNLFYMGAVDGGVWKSTSYGVRWQNISDGALPTASGGVGAVAVAPSDPKIIYVGTGESDIRADVITGDGVYKSSDAGKTWKYAGLRDTHTIARLVIDPRHPDVVYAASLGHVFQPNAERGVFKSTDGGASWRKVLFVNDETGAADLVMDPKDADVLYAAMWQAYRTPWKLSSGGPGSGLYKTTDGGAHWTDISRHPGLPQGPLGKIGVSVAAAKPDVVYAIVQAQDGGVFRSDDAGASWRRVSDNWKLRQRAFYYMSIFADPKDPDTVYVPEVDGLFVSHDGGRKFKKLKTPHGDNHVLWINPDDTRIMLEGNDGGATVTTDGGKTWSSEHNQPTGQFYHVNLDDRFPVHIYGAQQDEGSFEGPSASAQKSIGLGEWRRVAYGESTFTVPQPGHPDVTYGSGYYSIFLNYDQTTEQYRSVSPWPLYQEGAAAEALKYRLAWTHPILFSPADPKELLLGAQYVLKSLDGGRTWRRISPDLTRNDPATEAPSGGPVDLDQSGAELYPSVAALAVSPLDGKVIWAGSDDGLVHVTTDGGAHWRAARPPDLPERSDVNSIEPSHADKGTAYLAAHRYMWDDFHPYVYKTTDYGRHWTTITAGLPDDQYAFTVRQDPDDADLLFLGTRNTVYVSLDGGARWQPLKLDLPPVQVRDVAINTRQGKVVIATHGRAFWVLDNLALLEQFTRHPATDADGAGLFAPQTAWLTHAYGEPDPDEPKPHDVGKNPPFGATVFFHIPAGYDGKTPVRLEFADAQGRLIRSFDLHLKKKTPPQAKSEESEDNEDNDDSDKNPVEKKKEREGKLTAIEPGMNRFQWNLRYPDAAEVEGFWPPIAAGGLTDQVDGPVVAPGAYRVTLDYGGHRIVQSFSVALDPRLHATKDALAARLALEIKIHDTLDRLDQALNRAIAVRDGLRTAVAAHRLDGARAGEAIAALDRAVNGLVQLDLHSSEGTLLHETKLRSHLAYLQADIELAYAQPTPAQQDVYEALKRQADAGEQALQQAIAAGERLL